MSGTHHERLQELFLAAVDRGADERAEYLEKACAGDEDLKREVEELVAADGSLHPDTAANIKEKIKSVSPYRILSEIGRGGMGVVYLAERADGAFKRLVAIKVVNQQAPTDSELTSRLSSERQILAALDHPNIARLLDGGTLPDGSPFLVMEHVEGETICDYAKARDLCLDARLELFVAVCDAVQAAHQSLVVHRDIKPSNVLVTGDGIPKLLDFGVAKILDPRLADWTVAATRFGDQPLTPRYASPEQLTGDAITTATDVYALGVLLYELLTGELPYRPQSSALHHWIEAVCEHEPRRPSLALQETTGEQGTPQKAPPLPRGSLEGDIDHIVLMALRKEPRSRYATAAELAADLRRHLAGMPILARPATLSYRFGKLIRRHRWAVAAALAAVLTAAGFTVSLVRQLERTEYERDRAETVKDLLVEVFSAAGPGAVEGREPTAREVLGRGLEAVQGGLDDQPEVKAALLDDIGSVYFNLGRLEEAEKAHQQALELRRSRRQAAPLEYAQSLGSLARVYLARNQLHAAESSFREAWTMTVAEVGKQDHRSVAYLDGLASTLSQMGRYQKAVELSREVLDLTLKRLGFDSVESVLASDSRAPELVAVATTVAGLGAEQRELGRYRDAERSLSLALALNRRLLGEHHFAVAFNLNNLANLHMQQEQYERALAERAEALDIAEAVLGVDHPSVGKMRLNSGIELQRLGRLDKALDNTSRAQDIFSNALGPQHPAAALAMAYTGLVEAGLGRQEAALTHCREAVDLLVKAHGEQHPEVARSKVILAQAQGILGHHAEAVERFQEALAILGATMGPDHPDTLECRSAMAEPLLTLGRFGEARAVLEPARAAYEARGDLLPHLARVRFRLARAIAADGPLIPDAARLAEQALAAWQEIGDQTRVAEIEAWLGARR